MQEAFAVNPMPKTNRKMPLTGTPRPRQSRRRKEQRFGRYDIVLAAMDQENGRGSAGGLGGKGAIAILRRDKLARITKDARGRPRAPQSGMKREHRPLAEAGQGELAVVQSVPVEFGIKESVESRGCFVDTGPAFARVAHGQTEPLPPARGLAARLGRIRRDKCGARHKISPLVADCDQIVAVGAISVQKDDKLLRPLRFCREARPIKRCRHVYRTAIFI